MFQQQQNSSEAILQSRLRAIHLSYAPLLNAHGVPAAEMDPTLAGYSSNDEKCEFDAIMYDSIPSRSGTQMVTNFPKFQLSKLRMSDADNHNPDHNNCVPVRILGINELTDRYLKQCKDSDSMIEYLSSFKTHISRLRDNNSSETLRLVALRNEYSRLYNKSLQLLRKVEVLRNYRANLESGENDYKQRVTKLSQLTKQAEDRLHSLADLKVSRIKYLPLNPLLNPFYLFIWQDHSNFAKAATNESATVAISDIENIRLALEKQRDGLQVLTELISRDLRDISIIQSELSIRR